MKCEHKKCNNDHDGSYGSGRFCSNKCARSFSSFEKRDEINKKLSAMFKGKPTKIDNLNKKYVISTEERRKGGQRSRHKTYQDIRDDIVNLDWSAYLKKYGTKGSIRVRIVIEQYGRCNKCLNYEWLNEPIKLELHHIDGNNTNNNRDNLEMLCPNCHSYTDNFRGRNINIKSNSELVSEDEIIRLFKELGSIRQVLISIGLKPMGGNYTRINRIISKISPTTVTKNID